MPALQGDRLLQIAHRYVNSSPSPHGAATSQRRCPIVLYSDRPEADLRQLADSCGADGYVRKTSNFQHIIETIHKLLAKSR
jgi:DNA-binding NarL/FixJ family response regulator